MGTVAFVTVIGLVALLVYMARYSGRLRVTQTRLIDAPIDKVYALVADFRAWALWNPWLEHEPEARVTLSESTADDGSAYGWDGARAGRGTVVHRRMVAGRSIEQRLRFEQPFRIRGHGHWQFAEREGKTEVTWSMTGRVAFALRAFAPTVQGMIALDHRYGLDRLARLLEPAAAPRYSLDYLGVRDIPAGCYVYRSYSGTLAGLADGLRGGFAELRGQLDGAGLQASAAPIAIYVRTNFKLRTTDCYLGIPVAKAEPGRLPLREMPAHSAYVLRLQGSQAALEVAWYQLMQRMRVEAVRADPRIPPFERYPGHFDTVAESDRVIELHLPVRRRA